MANMEISMNTLNANLSDLHNDTLRKATEDIFKAYAAIDTSAGALAYAMHNAQMVFSGLDKRDTIDGYHNFAEYAEKRIGVKKAQAYNLATAGSFLRVIKVKAGNSTRKVFVDKWTCAVAKLTDKDAVYENIPESLSNTVILTIARYCNKADDNEKRVYSLIMEGTIKAGMSVAMVDSILNPKETKAIEDNSTPEQSNQVDNETPEQSNQVDNETPETPEQIQLNLGKVWVFENLLPVLLRYEDDAPEIADLIKAIKAKQ